MAEWGGGFRGGNGGSGALGSGVLLPSPLRGCAVPYGLCRALGKRWCGGTGGSSASGNAGLCHGLCLRKAETSASPALL